MGMTVILGAIILWCFLFAICFWGGCAIIDSIYRSRKKNWVSDPEGAEEEKKTFRLYVLCFFVGIPILSIAALFMEG